MSLDAPTGIRIVQVSERSDALYVQVSWDKLPVDSEATHVFMYERMADGTLLRRASLTAWGGGSYIGNSFRMWILRTSHVYVFQSAVIRVGDVRYSEMVDVSFIYEDQIIITPRPPARSANWVLNAGHSWPFVKQPNKWGYLNNPRWQGTARAFYHGGPDDYDGRESEEPQMWIPPDKSAAYSRNAQGIHHQCGHWHRILGPTSLAPTTAAPETFIPWWSCPEAIIPLSDGTGDIWFVTTDDGEGRVIADTSTLWILHYSRAADSWDVVYSENLTDPEIVTIDWAEPDIAIATKGSMRVIVLIRAFTEYSYAWGLQVLVFSGDVLLNNTIINGDASLPWGTFLLTGNVNVEKYVLIDDINNIHILMRNNKTGFKISDFISSDNGATFSYVNISTSTTAEPRAKTINQLSDGSIYAHDRIRYFKSTDNGATWVGPTTWSAAFYIEYIGMLNDVFLGVRRNTVPAIDTIDLVRSTDGSTWATIQVLDNANNSFRWDGASMVYDGTYYYVAVQFRDSSADLGPGWTDIWRSDDSVNWTKVATIVDDSQIASGGYDELMPTQIILSDGVLYYFFYYSQDDTDSAGSYFNCVWKSEDQGVTWEIILTPFFDWTRPGNIEPPH